MGITYKEKMLSMHNLTHNINWQSGLFFTFFPNIFLLSNFALVQTQLSYSSKQSIQTCRYIVLLYIAVVLCVVFGQLHADKCDYHAKVN